MKRLLPLYAVGAYLFLHLPLAILGVFSFNQSKFIVWEGFSLRWYAAALHDTAMAESAVNSLLVAAAATVLSAGACA